MDNPFAAPPPGLDAGSLPSDIHFERPDPPLRLSRASAARVAWIEAFGAALVSGMFMMALLRVDRPDIAFPIAVVVLSALSVPKNRYLRSLGAHTHRGALSRWQWHQVAYMLGHPRWEAAGYWGVRAAVVAPLAASWLMTLGK